MNDTRKMLIRWIGLLVVCGVCVDEQWAHGQIPTPGIVIEYDAAQQPTVEIVSADVTQNQIQVRLGPADTAGTLTLELRDPDTHVILNVQARTGSDEVQNETFDLDNWNDEAIGQYTRLRATWTVGLTENWLFKKGCA